MSNEIDTALLAKREKGRQATARYRERQKALGVVPRKTTSAQKVKQREYMARKRAEARAAGHELPSDAWWKLNPDKHRKRTNRWRAKNLEHMREINRRDQAERRSTPWGTINNRMIAVLHWGVRSSQSGVSKYTQPLGYAWVDLRTHLEKQFTPDMNWENWGDVWEIDHITPLSSFKYTSLDDPLFRECWRLENLRPLGRFENNSKGNKIHSPAA